MKLWQLVRKRAFFPEKHSFICCLTIADVFLRRWLVNEEFMWLVGGYVWHKPSSDASDFYKTVSQRQGQGWSQRSCMAGLWMLWHLEWSLTCLVVVSSGNSLTGIQANPRKPPQAFTCKQKQSGDWNLHSSTPKWSSLRISLRAFHVDVCFCPWCMTWQRGTVVLLNKITVMWLFSILAPFSFPIEFTFSGILLVQMVIFNDRNSHWSQQTSLHSGLFILNTKYFWQHDLRFPSFSDSTRAV